MTPRRAKYLATQEDCLAYRRGYVAAKQADVSSRFRTYWAVNGETIRARRQSKYRTDPEYRARILASNRNSRKKAHGAPKKDCR